MRTSLLSLLTLALFNSPALKAQEVPGETPGDLGWVVLGTDTLTVVRASDGHVWLQQNLGATETAPAPDVSATYGHLYQWGRWDDGHALRTSATADVTTLAVNNPIGLALGSGTTIFYTGTDPLHWWSNGSDNDTWAGTLASATNGKDPCAALGGEWNLPTQTDWMDVLAAESITDLSTGLASNLRLPAAGSRHALTGTLINVGSFGNYWSSTPSGIYAKDLTIGDSFVNANDDGYRGYGMSCRCMNKNLHVGLREQGTVRVALFPNPANASITVRCDETVLRMIVYDVTGRVVATLPVNAMSATVELPSLAEGPHMVSVLTASGVHHASVVIAK